MKRTLSSHFLLFALIGGAGTLTHYLLMILLASGFGVNSLLAAQAGAALGALVNYGLNHRLNYCETRSHRHTGPRFAAVVAVGFVINGLVVAGLTSAAGWHYIAAQLGATALVLLWGFVANHFWTFSRGFS